MDKDGTKTGYDLEMLNVVCTAVNIPVVASGGCGKISDIVEVFQKTRSDAALVASLFHYGEATVDEVKEAIAARNVSLADTKARSEKANAASGAGTVTNAAASSANSQFKF